MPLSQLKTTFKLSLGGPAQGSVSTLSKLNIGRSRNASNAGTLTPRFPPLTLTPRCTPLEQCSALFKTSCVPFYIFWFVFAQHARHAQHAQHARHTHTRAHSLAHTSSAFFFLLSHDVKITSPKKQIGTATLNNNIFDGSKQKQRGVNLFQHHFVKVEDMSGKYRPFYHEYEKHNNPIPVLNFHTPPTSCPFDPRAKSRGTHKSKGRDQVCVGCVFECVLCSHYNPLNAVYTHTHTHARTHTHTHTHTHTRAHTPRVW